MFTNKNKKILFKNNFKIYFGFEIKFVDLKGRVTKM